MPDFEIYALPLLRGQLAISPIPGRGGDLSADLAKIQTFNPTLLITATTQTELDSVGAQTLPNDLHASNIDWHHMPIPDFSTPNDQTNLLWPSIANGALTALQNAQNILIHCFGGQGRSGMLALRLMIDSGETPENALARLRKIRPKAVETDAQFKWAAKRT